MIRKILLDLDNVCNTFSMYALKHVGCKVDARDYTQYPPGFGWGIAQAANALLGEERFTEDSFFKALDHNLWATIPLSQEFNWLLGHCEVLVGRKNICILTSPTSQPFCAAAKMEWIQQFMPRWLHRQFLIGPAKTFCAHPESLLIDDHEDNCDAFVTDGGRALLVPRPWNRLRDRNTQRWLQQCLSKLIQEKQMYAPSLGESFVS